jgi:glycosyltransferase involved in cell wall biosynthesis
MARQTDWRVTLLCLHDPVGEVCDEATGLRIVSLGLDGNCARQFLQWLAANPQDIVITSDVSHIEVGFPFIPKETLHVIQMHDSLRRYRDVAVRNHAWVDGVVCVARHIEAPLRANLKQTGFHGLLATVHNGAAFPPPPVRTISSGPLRLIFVGRMDPFKGIFDLVPILQRLDKMKVPVRLTIVGGRHELLARRFRRKKLDHLVTWTGRVPHEDCYRLAATNDVFLMPSRQEPFGMVTIEAMSMGCVPVAYDTPSGSTEIIEAGRSGLLVPLGDFAAWAQAVKSLHDDREQLWRLSEEAMRRARTVFSETAMVAKLLEFLDQVQSNTRSHPADRHAGLPVETETETSRQKLHYRRLPPALREWVRNRIGASPRLSYWFLQHWNQ